MRKRKRSIDTFVNEDNSNDYNIEEKIDKSWWLPKQLLKYYQRRRGAGKRHNKWDWFIESLIYGKLTQEEQETICRLNHNPGQAWKITAWNAGLGGAFTFLLYGLATYTSFSLPELIQDSLPEQISSFLEPVKYALEPVKYALAATTIFAFTMDFGYRLPRAFFKKKASISYDPIGILVFYLPTKCKRMYQKIKQKP